MYETTLITDEKDFFPLHGEWNALVEKLPFPTIFYTWEWLATWWRVVGEVQPETSLHLLVARKEGKLAGIAPFMEVQQPNGIDLCFLGDPYTDYHDVFTRAEDSEEVLAEFFGYLQRHRHEWNSIQLNGIPDRSPTLEYLEKIGLFHLEQTEKCLVADLTDPAHFNYITSKKNQVRNIRLLNQSGKLSCDHFFSEREISERFGSFRSMHQTQWQDQPDAVGTFDDVLVSRFFEALIGVMAKQEWLMFTELRYNDAPIAYYYAFYYNNRYWGYRTCYASEVAKSSPGHILLKCIIEFLQQRHCSEMDLLRGNYSYKGRYSNREIRNWKLYA